MSRVKASRSPVRRRDPDRGGQQPIERLLEALGRDWALQLARRDLPERVHAGIGPAGSNSPHGLAFDLGQGFLEHTLDRRAAGLHLPARVVRPVVS